MRGWDLTERNFDYAEWQRKANRTSLKRGTRESQVRDPRARHKVAGRTRHLAYSDGPAVSRFWTLLLVLTTV